MPGIFSALALLAVVTGAAQTGPAPIHLVMEPASDGVRLKVVGNSDTSLEARYSLEVTGGNGGNRSLQRGEARLRPGETVTLVTLTLGNQAQDWSAVLKVAPANGPSYEQSESSR